uniref:hypothetical protein n=1 Tax=Pseudomonas sp. TaxID=306 RepID=UPI0026168966
MGLTWDEAVAVVQQRRLQQEPLLSKMVDVQRRYNGEYVLPAPSTGPDEPRPVVIAQLVAEAIDFPALQASSVMPMFDFPATDPQVTLRVENARVRKRAAAATLFRSDFHLGVRKAFRHIAGYTSASMVLIPDDGKRPGNRKARQPGPRLYLRDPLTTYADPRSNVDFTPPVNVGYVHQVSAAVLMGAYRNEMTQYFGDIFKNGSAGGPLNELWDIMEWIDEDMIRMGVIGPSNLEFTEAFNIPAYGVELRHWENKAGMCPAVCPRVITLDKIISRAMQMTGQVDTLAYLYDLDIQATKRAIFPDRYIISEPNLTPGLVDGKWHTGDTGMTNLVTNARQVGELRSGVDPGVFQRMTALTDMARQSAGITGLSGGDVSGYGGGLRTGRGMGQLMDIAVNPRVQELQEVMAHSLTNLVEPMFEMYEGYWPSKKFVLFSGWPTDKGQVEFTPNKELAESNECVCTYPIPGADLNGTIVALGQMMQAKMASAKTVRMQNPLISDPEFEERQITEEAFTDMALEAMHTQTAAGTLSMIDLAVIASQVEHGEKIWKAIQVAQEAAQARQATQAPPGAPETQPGLAQPGQGVEQPPAGGGA